jgi:hypothetical protein
VEELADCLRSVGFEDEVGEVTLLRRLQSEPVDVALHEANPARFEIFGTEHLADAIHLDFVLGGTFGRAVGEGYRVEHRNLLWPVLG